MVKTLEELNATLSSLGYPVAFDHFETEQKFPYFIYIVTGETHEYADGQAYAKTMNIQLEMYTENKNISLEDKIESLLENSELLFDKNEGNIYEGNDRFYMVTYQFQVMKGN